MQVYFEKVSKYKDSDIAAPTRATENAAGYDMVAAEDTVIPSYLQMFKTTAPSYRTMTIDEVAKFTKDNNFKPTLVPTGHRVIMPENFSCELYVRSSSPLKYWIIMANGVGLIDADYAKADNEGHIFFQLINLFPNDIIIRKGEAIGQAVFRQYEKTSNDNEQDKAIRTGGFGSTT